MGQDTISRLATGRTEIRTYGFSFGNLRRNEQLQTRLGLNQRPLVWSSKPLAQITALVHSGQKCLVGPIDSRSAQSIYDDQMSAFIILGKTNAVASTP